MNSTTSSIVTALGAGSGIDMAALASNLALAQFQPKLDRIATRTEMLERQISKASELRNMMTTLASSLGDRIRVGDLSPQPQVANASVAQASATPGATANATYALEVLALASAQTLSTPALASASAPVGAGTLTLRFGEITDGTFTADAGRAPVDITIASGSSLSSIAGAINAAGTGVTAYVAQGTNGAQLVLKGAEGAANGFVLEANETPGDEGLAALAWEPATGDPARLAGAAQDAQFRLDGVEMRAATNSVAQAAPGLSLTLTGTNVGAPTRITFSNPGETIAGAMQDLTGALNEVAGALAAATAPQGGDLARDSGARALRRIMAELAGTVVMPNAVPGAPRTLADLGLATERDGTFRLDTARLNATLASNPEGTAAMFTTRIHGVYATVDRIARAMNTSRDPGSLAGSVARYSSLMTKLSEESGTLLEKQENLRAQLTRRFAVADSRIGASQSTLSFLQSQIDAWNAGKD